MTIPHFPVGKVSVYFPARKVKGHPEAVYPGLIFWRLEPQGHAQRDAPDGWGCSRCLAAPEEPPVRARELATEFFDRFAAGEFLPRP